MATSTTPWVEKYRPSRVEEIVQQDEVVASLKTSIENGELPHLIFHGPPGTGKTSTALALCHSLYDKTEFKQRVIELNASDERGIDAVRTKIKKFASLSVPPGRIPYKVVILDEADSMTQQAQDALRRVIEDYSAVTRFIIICNYISRIIDPILSRCARFRFKPLAHDPITTRLSEIALNEGLSIEDDSVFDTLVEISGGDLRKAITFMQSASITGSLSSGIIREISGTPNPSFVAEYLNACVTKQWDALVKATNDVVLSGFDLSQILEMLINCIITSEHIKEADKAKIIWKIGEAEGSINVRADPIIQFLSIASHIYAVRV